MASVAVTVAIVGLEVVGGLWSHSLALLSDAGHMATDTVALLLSLAAVWATSRPADARRTYGYYRFEILCALANGMVLLPVSVGIAVEAWRRFRDPPPIHAPTMMTVAVIGLVANVVVFALLRRSKSMNVRGAVLHVLGDALSSVGVIVAGGVLMLTGWTWVDPAMSVVIAGVIVFSAVGLMREAVDVLLEAVPSHLNLAEVFKAIQGVEGVLEVHDLHVWTLSSHFYALSAHLVVRPASVGQNDAILACVLRVLHDRFGIEHTTIQIESQTFAHAAHPG